MGCGPAPRGRTPIHANQTERQAAYERRKKVTALRSDLKRQERQLGPDSDLLDQLYRAITNRLLELDSDHPELNRLITTALRCPDDPNQLFRRLTNLASTVGVATQELKRTTWELKQAETTLTDHDRTLLDKRNGETQP
jgi:ABC-type transporter Mla subunit MlaD